MFLRVTGRSMQYVKRVPEQVPCPEPVLLELDDEVKLLK
jgi:hypothetical protein